MIQKGLANDNVEECNNDFSYILIWSKYKNL